MEHHLNITEGACLVKKSRQHFSPEKYKIIAKEVTVGSAYKGGPIFRVDAKCNVGPKVLRTVPYVCRLQKFK